MKHLTLTLCLAFFSVVAYGQKTVYVMNQTAEALMVHFSPTDAACNPQPSIGPFGVGPFSTFQITVPDNVTAARIYDACGVPPFNHVNIGSTCCGATPPPPTGTFVHSCPPFITFTATWARCTPNADLIIVN